MKWIRVAIVLSCITAVPAFAATFDLTGWAAWVDPNSNGTFNATSPNLPFDVSFNGRLGYGIGANFFSAAISPRRLTPSRSVRKQRFVLTPSVEQEHSPTVCA